MTRWRSAGTASCDRRGSTVQPAGTRRRAAVVPPHSRPEWSLRERWRSAEIKPAASSVGGSTPVVRWGHSSYALLPARPAGRQHEVGFKRDGKLLADASGDGTVRLWNPPPTRQPVAPRSWPVPPRGRMTAMASQSGTSNCCAHRSQRRNGAAVNPATGQAVGAPLPARTGPQQVAAVAFSPDGRLLASAGADEHRTRHGGLRCLPDELTQHCAPMSGHRQRRTGRSTPQVNPQTPRLRSTQTVPVTAGLSSGLTAASRCGSRSRRGYRAGPGRNPSACSGDLYRRCWRRLVLGDTEVSGRDCPSRLSMNRPSGTQRRSPSALPFALLRRASSTMQIRSYRRSSVDFAVS